MFRDDVVNRILLGCANRSEATYGAAVRNYLLDVQQELENEGELPWFLRTEVSSVSTLAGEERVAKPADFLAEWEDDALWFYDTEPEPGYPNWVKLWKGETDGLRQDIYTLRQINDPGGPSPQSIVKPQWYAFDGTYFRIFPTPDKIYQLRMIYYAKDRTLETNLENKWLTYVPELFIGLGGQKIGADLEISQRRMQRFINEEARGRARILAKTVELQMTNREMTMGGADN